MSPIDWAVFVAFLAWVVWDGMRRGRGATTLEAYFAGNRAVPWWAAGLSIMATQASAITIIGTTGQGYESGMEFVQLYIGLAFAMVLLSIFFVPLYRSQPILTAYEYLEGRFGVATRTLASLIFLVSRCLAFGVVIYAPAVVVSAMLKIDLTVTVLAIGGLTTIYTMVGGVQAVISTDVKQMSVIVGGLLVILIILLVDVLPELGLRGTLDVLGATGKLNAIELAPASTEMWPRWKDEAGGSFWSDKYNFWAGMFGGLFLMLSYFGCDQTQVQRILTNPSADESRKALLMSAWAKVPMQAVVLFIGVLLYAFYVLNGSPLLFNPNDREAAKAPAIAAAVGELQARSVRAQVQREGLAREIAKPGPASPDVLEEFRRAVNEVEDLRQQARNKLQEQHETPRDTNYIFPHFLLENVPVVLLGLIMAAIFAAMMSSADSALNALTASSIVDIYRRFLRPGATERESLFASRITTAFWGMLATSAALLFEGSGSVIELVNMIGSFFYGSLLGVFVLAMLSRRSAAGWFDDLVGFVGLLGGMAAVLAVHCWFDVEFLWYNVVGCIGVLTTGGLVGLFDRRR